MRNKKKKKQTRAPSVSISPAFAVRGVSVLRPTCPSLVISYSSVDAAVYTDPNNSVQKTNIEVSGRRMMMSRLSMREEEMGRWCGMDDMNRINFRH